jgi:hypothetical protein
MTYEELIPMPGFSFLNSMSGNFLFNGMSKMINKKRPHTHFIMAFSSFFYKSIYSAYVIFYVINDLNQKAWIIHVYKKDGFISFYLKNDNKTSFLWPLL